MTHLISQHLGVGWLLVVSDNPVIVTGKNERRKDGTRASAANMQLRPIDCAGDQTGIEHVGDVVEKLQQGK